MGDKDNPNDNKLSDPLQPLFDRLDKQEAEITELRKAYETQQQVNRGLLSTTPTQQNADVEHDRLRKKLMEGLHR